MQLFFVHKKEGLKTPLIEEQNNQFRLTLYGKRTEMRQLLLWEESLIHYLQENPSITTRDAAKIWSVTTRTARTRLQTMVESGILQRIGTSAKDPFSKFILRK